MQTFIGRKYKVLLGLLALLFITALVRSTRRVKPPFGVYTRFVNMTKTSEYYQCPAPVWQPARQPLPAGFPSDWSSCTSAFVRYEPAADETDWRERAAVHRDDSAAAMCAVVLDPERALRSEAWLGQRALVTKSRAMSVSYLEPAALMSKMHYELKCPNGQSHSWAEWIEPLTLSGRHPFALASTCCALGGTSTACNVAPPREDLMSIDHLVMQSKESPFWPLHAPAASSHAKAFLFDVGTSFFDTSMLVLACTYKHLRGIEFDAMYGWEATVLDKTEYWARVAPEFRDRVHFTNLPASSTPGAETNPLTVLRSVARPSDYVAFKLDIDHTRTELELLRQILDDPDTRALVDELFYEYHFDFPPMAKYWFVTGGEAKVDGAMELFARARALGIRMHFWP